MEKEDFIQIAIEEAKKAYELGEVPIAAVIEKDGEIISKAHNMQEINKDATQHAEIIAIQEACKKLDNWRLEDCNIYVTLEPCAMCMGAIIQARLKNVYYLAKSPRFGCANTKVNLPEILKEQYYVNTELIENGEYIELLKSFFKELRK